jgi:hypothetical protein
MEQLRSRSKVEPSRPGIRFFLGLPYKAANYHLTITNRAIETAQVIEELIKMAKDFQEAMKRDEALGLSPGMRSPFMMHRPTMKVQCGN